MLQKMNLDKVRFILSFFVIAIHISPFIQINPEFDFFFTRVLSRIAVPLYLMITGYYILEKSLSNREYLIQYTIKILKLYGRCILLYLPINVYMHSFDAGWIAFLQDVLIDGTMYHLWYFPALILGIWLVYFLIRTLNQKYTGLIVSLLYFIGLFGDSYYGVSQMSSLLVNLYSQIWKVFDYTRNGLFFTPIFLYLGYYVKLNKNKLKDHSVFPFLCFLGMSIEGLLLHRLDLQRHDSMYLFLVPFVYFLFRYFMTVNQTENKRLRSMATSIYIIHPLIIVIVRFIFKIFKVEKMLVDNNLILYICVCCFSVLSAFIFEVGKKYVVKKQEFK